MSSFSFNKYIVLSVISLSVIAVMSYFLLCSPYIDVGLTGAAEGDEVVYDFRGEHQTTIRVKDNSIVHLPWDMLLSDHLKGVVIYSKKGQILWEGVVPGRRYKIALPPMRR